MMHKHAYTHPQTHHAHTIHVAWTQSHTHAHIVHVHAHIRDMRAHMMHTCAHTRTHRHTVHVYACIMDTVTHMLTSCTHHGHACTHIVCMMSTHAQLYMNMLCTYTNTQHGQSHTCSHQAQTHITWYTHTCSLFHLSFPLQCPSLAWNIFSLLDLRDTELPKPSPMTHDKSVT